MKSYGIKASLGALLVVLIISCQKRREQGEARPMNEPHRSLEQLEDESFNGSLESYLELRTAMLDFPPESMFYWALHTANRYGHAQAHLDVYQSFMNTYKRRGLAFDKIDSETRALLLKHLRIASKKGLPEAKQILVDLKQKEGNEVDEDSD
jgi:hypothetical protein